MSVHLDHGGLLVLTGAGVSAESGVPTFRDANGLWENHAIEDVASPEGFTRDPWLVWRFYSARRRGAFACTPNPAHRALADAERALGTRFLLCTQNVDPLHERAGSRRIVHVHGRLDRSRCSNQQCDAPPLDDVRSYATLDAVPSCDRCHARLRPDIVWFGEVPAHLDVLEAALARCGAFLAIGTSGHVWPVAGFVGWLARHRPQVPSAYVGPDRPANAESFHELVFEPASTGVAKALASLLVSVRAR
ncbi:MAG: NAD-dependent deacylase [Deltaproteobacteria bacterium]|nr:NAD-dependent deacylase [Deltaproteobacteria bacterium]